MLIYKYPLNILQVLDKALHGTKSSFKWLLENGYPELAAFANAVRGDDEAFHWLLKYKFIDLAMLCKAIDDDDHAIKWLIDFEDPILLRFSLACKKHEESIEWLTENKCIPLVILAQEIAKILEVKMKDEVFWYKRK